MFAWLKLDKSARGRDNARVLYEAVREALHDSDDVHVRIVGSIAALLLCVAYADSEYHPTEEALLRKTLAQIRGLDAAGVDAIAEVLRAHTVLITAAEASSYGRELLELSDDDFRLALLDVLVDVAAADGEISAAETNVLRTAARSLGLSQAAYNASQARHRDKLSVLKR